LPLVFVHVEMLSTLLPSKLLWTSWAVFPIEKLEQLV